MIDQPTYNTYFDNLLEGNKQACLKIVENFLDQGIEIRELYSDLFQKSLYKIGELWEYNKISVAHEHLATAITESLLNNVYPVMFRAEHINKTAIVACTNNELHQIGAKMVADFFEINGWNSYFVGSSSPVNELIKLIELKKPDVIALSVSISFNIPAFEVTLNEIRKTFPSTKIIFGGQAFHHGAPALNSKYKKIKHIRSLNQLESYLKQHTE